MSYQIITRLTNPSLVLLVLVLLVLLETSVSQVATVARLAAHAESAAAVAVARVAGVVGRRGPVVGRVTETIQHFCSNDRIRIVYRVNRLSTQPRNLSGLNGNPVTSHCSQCTVAHPTPRWAIKRALGCVNPVC